MGKFGKETRELWPIGGDARNDGTPEGSIWVTVTREPSAPNFVITNLLRFVGNLFVVLVIVVLVYSFFKSAAYPQELRNIAFQKDFAEVQYTLNLFGDWIKNTISK
jgi:hypothetical protein